MSFAYRQTFATIDLAALRHNFNVLRQRLPAAQNFFAVVKANAYGHGASVVAKTLLQCGVTLFGVATLDEACALRTSGITGQIFVLNGVQGPIAVYQNYALIPVLHAWEELAEIKKAKANGLLVALKFDTGMGRLGFFPEELPQILTEIKRESLVLNSVFTHLARADESADFVAEPLLSFVNLAKQIQNAGFANVTFSLHNSAATLDAVPASMQWYRPGLALYGCYPNARQKSLLDLKPVLQWQTQIMSLKNFSAGCAIGYGATFVTQRASRIAILPVGYADGYVRQLSNTGFVLVCGQRAPVVGRVSMDLTAIDVTDIPEAQMHSVVTLIGTDQNESITAEDVAHWAKTISYEILCGISARVWRRYINA